MKDIYTIFLYCPCFTRNCTIFEWACRGRQLPRSALCISWWRATFSSSNKRVIEWYNNATHIHPPMTVRKWTRMNRLEPMRFISLYSSCIFRFYVAQNEILGSLYKILNQEKDLSNEVMSLVSLTKQGYSYEFGI